VWTWYVLFAHFVSDAQTIRNVYALRSLSVSSFVFTGLNKIAVFCMHLPNTYLSQISVLHLGLPQVILNRRTIGWLWFESRRGLEIFPFDTAFRPVLGPIQPPIQWVPGSLSLGVKRPGREADYSPPSSAQVKECVESYLHFHNAPS
jgi:hypothetical protein